MEVEPIKDLNKIQAIKVLLHNSNPRDEALFVLGINTALRIGDLLSLKMCDVLNETGQILDAAEVQEQKTRKKKRFPLNQSVRDALTCYLETRQEFCLDEPLFPSKRKGLPLSRWRARRILHAAGQAVGLSRIGTHSLRKTFAYHVYRRTGGNLGLVQKLLNHTSSADTLRYIGIDRDEMNTTYLELNL
ncbi:MAG: site-specific integrase [Synergistaceae bacterium]|nr:site-specific integrase [Synergistaceae bacterium]